MVRYMGRRRGLGKVVDVGVLEGEEEEEEGGGCVAMLLRTSDVTGWWGEREGRVCVSGAGVSCCVVLCCVCCTAGRAMTREFPSSGRLGM